jgi:hypothetical protein
MEPKTTGTTRNNWKPPRISPFCAKNVKFIRLTKIHDDRDHSSHIYCLNNMEPTTPGTTKNYWKPPKIFTFCEKVLNYIDLQESMTTGTLQVIFTAQATWSQKHREPPKTTGNHQKYLLFGQNY